MLNKSKKKLLLAAIDNCSLRLKQNIEVYDTLIKRGVLWEMQGNYLNSIQDFSEAIAIDSNVADAFYLRAYTFLNQGNLKEAIHDFCCAKNITMGLEEFDEANIIGLIGRIRAMRNVILKNIEQKLSFEKLNKKYGFNALIHIN